VPIKRGFYFFSKIIFLTLSVFLCFVTGLLFSEYLFFKKQSDKLLELQSDYRTYMLVVNKVLHDYNKTKEKLDVLASLELDSQPEKKKEVEFIGLGFFAFDFPEGAHVFSSDDVFDSQEKDSLLLINRDPDYLRDAAADYFKKNGTESLYSQVHLDNWCDYTQYALSKEKPRKKLQKKQACKKKRNKKVASYRRPRTLQKKDEKKDIFFVWPIERSNFWISSLFGPRKKPNGSWGFHYGIDMASMRGTKVCAASSGIVTEARYSKGYGNTIVITHNRKYRTRYAHLDKILVRVGQKVKTNQLIGKVGRTGLVWRSRGRDPSHLHFEVYTFGKQVNPLKFLA